ncbi:MAG TPA: hypothetical protein VMA95_10035, partial [Streptosporangiaceae bacterium]|nr:hypothetical protein [Streptosporangiaceae bacterium]
MRWTRQGRRLPDAPRVPGIHSPRVKLARQLARRNQREKARLFLAEGPQAVREALGFFSGAGRPGRA